MNSAQPAARRATLEDLPKLRALWEKAGLAPAELERRLTEFQVVEGADGQLLGAIGLQLEKGHGRLHSEALGPDVPGKEIQAALWDRVQALARNHGLARLWMENEEPFWNAAGFEPAAEETVKKLPVALGSPMRSWRTLLLKEEQAATLSPEKEFEMFQQAQRLETERVLRQARVMKWIAIVVLSLVLMWLTVAGLSILRDMEILKQRSPATGRSK